MTLIPLPIARLPELARNLWWSWHPEARDLFEELERAVLDPPHHNPLSLLQGMREGELELRAKDPEFIKRYNAVVAAFDDDMAGKTTRFASRFPRRPPARDLRAPRPGAGPYGAGLHPARSDLRGAPPAPGPPPPCGGLGRAARSRCTLFDGHRSRRQRAVGPGTLSAPLRWRPGVAPPSGDRPRDRWRPPAPGPRDCPGNLARERGALGPHDARAGAGAHGGWPYL